MATAPKAMYKGQQNISGQRYTSRSYSYLRLWELRIIANHEMHRHQLTVANTVSIPNTTIMARVKKGKPIGIVTSHGKRQTEAEDHSVGMLVRLSHDRARGCKTWLVLKYENNPTTQKFQCQRISRILTNCPLMTVY